MKRFTLSMSLLTVALGSVSAYAQTDEIVYGYCGDPAECVGVMWQEYSGYVEFPEDFTKRFNGSEVIAVEIASPMNFEDPEVNNFIDIDLQFRRALTDEPFYSQPAQLSEKGFDWKRISLDTPLKIEEGKPFFVGYSGIAPTIDDACFAVDFQYNSDNLGFWLGWADAATSKMTWESFTQYYGNMCLRLVIQGNNLPSDEVSLEWIYPPMFTTTDEPFAVDASIVNNAANEIKKLAFEYTIGNRTDTIEVDVNPPLKYNESTDVNVPGLICSAIGNRLILDMNIISVNGNDDAKITTTLDEDVFVYSIPKGVGYEKNIVVEEGTGTWCGYCPVGIVGMEYMKEKYTDGTYIPVAIHYNDRMVSRSYTPIADEYFSVYPSAIINRDTYRFGVFSPQAYLLEAAYTMAREIPAFASISADANFSDSSRSSIDINTTTSFAIQSDDSFSVAFAVTQDNVGPYDQTNYFANGSEGEMGGWENKPAEVSTYYNDVARGYYVAGEIDNTPNEEHPFSYTLPLDFLKEDKDSFTLVAMVINNATGDIENAVAIKSGSFTRIKQTENVSTQIKAMRGSIQISGSDSNVSIYSTDGKLLRTVTEDGSVALPSGMYIVKCGKQTQKIVL